MTSPTLVYGIGTAKSGTHSIHELLAPERRSGHESESGSVIKVILARQTGRVSDTDLDDHLLDRCRRLALEVDVSQLNIFFLPRLVELFPTSKFLLTIREPRSWLDSFINHQLARPCTEDWSRLRDLRFRPDLHAHQRVERALQEHGLYTLDGYLSYWRAHNQLALSTVPEKRLLVVRTDHITKRMDEIAELAGISAGVLRPESSHAFKGERKFGVLEMLDPGFLERKLDEHCADLVARFFPTQD